MNVISVYTEAQAIGDGVLFRLSENVIVTTNLACTLAPSEDHETGFNLGALVTKILPAITKRTMGIFYDADATDYPDECDEGLACYMIGNHKVWIMPSYPGSQQITVMLPEDY